MKLKKYLIGSFFIATSLITYSSLNKIRNQIELQEKNLQFQIEDFNKKSERFFIKKQNTSSNLFFSKGNYVVSTKFNSDLYDANFLLNYHINHNFINIFLFEELPIKLKVSIGGKLKDTLNAENLNFKFKGGVKKSGDIYLKSINNNFSVIFPKPEEDINLNSEESNNNTLTGMKIEIKNGNFFINYNNKDNVLSLQSDKKEIFAYDLEEKEDNIKIDNLLLNYSNNLSNQNVGSFSIKASKVKDGVGNINIENINLNTGIESKENGYKILFATKVDTFEIMEQKKSKIDIRYSIDNLNSSMMKFYKNFTSKYAIGDDISSEDILAAKNAIIANLKTGISLNIENMQYKTEDSEVKIVGVAKIIPLKVKQKTLSLVENTNFNLNIKTNGEISEMINTLLLTNIDSPNKIKDSNPEIKKPEFIDDKFNLDIKYENNLLTVNNFQAPTVVNYFIFNWLSTLNSELGLDSINIEEYLQEQEILNNMEEELKKVGSVNF